MTKTTKKEQEIAKIITTKDFPFLRYVRIAEAIIKRIARRQNKLSILKKANYEKCNKNNQRNITNH
jgi:hypothetical protein